MTISADHRTSRLCLKIILILIAFGEVCRLGQYLANQSIASAEMDLLFNLKANPISRVGFTHLELASGSPIAAPPLFLILTKCIGEMFQYSLFSVRFLPVVSAMIALPIFSRLVWKVAGPVAAAWGTALFALSDALIYQGSNAKPYSIDVLVALLILWLVIEESREHLLRRIVLTALVAAFGFWVSYTTVFPFGAAVLIFAWDLRRAPGRQKLAACAVAVIPAVSFLVVYFFSMRVQRSSSLDVEWVDLVPHPERPWSLPGWAIARTWEIFQYELYPIGQVVYIAVAAGIIWLWQRGNGRRIVLLILPAILDCFAGLTKQYIYGGSRVTLFLAPYLLLLAAIGCAAFPDLLKQWAKVAQAAVLIILLIMAGVDVYQLYLPRNEGDMRDAVAYLMAHRQSGEEVYFVGRDSAGLVGWFCPDIAPPFHKVEYATTPIASPRYWLVLGYNPRKFHKVEPALSPKDRHIVESRSFHTNGADVVWIEPDAASTMP